MPEFSDNEPTTPSADNDTISSRGRLVFVGLLTLIIAITLPLDGPPSAPGILLVTTCMGLAAIIAIYFSVGKRSLTRFGLCIAFLVIDGFALIGPDEQDIAVGLLPVAIAIPISLILEMIKIRWGTFSRIQSPQCSFQEGLQFQIWHLFVATTIIAVFCAVFRAILPWLTDQNNELLFMLIVIAAILATNTLITVWALMGQTVLWRIFASILFLVGAFYLGRYLVPQFRTNHIWLGFVIFPWLASAIYLLLLRREGYRFVRGFSHES